MTIFSLLTKIPWKTLINKTPEILKTLTNIKKDTLPFLIKNENIENKDLLEIKKVINEQNSLISKLSDKIILLENENLIIKNKIKKLYILSILDLIILIFLIFFINKHI